MSKKNESNLLTDMILNENNIGINSPEFEKLGPEFKQGYDELKALVAAKGDSLLIEASDEQLSSILAEMIVAAAIKKEELSAVAKEPVGIFETIKAIAKQYKTIVDNVGFMLRKDGDSVKFFAIDGGGSIILHANKPLTYQLQELVKPTSTLNVKNLVKQIESVKEAKDDNIVYFLRAVNEKITVRCMKNGVFDLKFAEKPIENWLK